MARRSIEVPGLHHAGLPIPMASVVGNLLVSGGISPLDPDSGTIPPDVEEQVELVFANVRRVLDAAGGRPEDVAPSSSGTRRSGRWSTSTGW
jgi:enamine deaminase RidA (YjgF/YER057c/UK114 family)